MAASMFACDDNINSTDGNKPLPTNFEEYLSWACVMLQESYYPIITRGAAPVESTGAISRKGKKSELPPPSFTDTETDKEYSSEKYFYCKEETVKLEMVVDSSDFVVKLKFLKNKTVPRKLLMLIGLIIQFHPLLSSFHIDSGLDQNSLFELAKIVAANHITEIILDNTVFREANYYCLLENESQLKYLSLARCKINDKALQEIASRLSYPQPASKVLSVLNLSTNRITDRGAKYLGEMLKTNRKLAYLNLADNMITDNGAESIFNSLKEFPITIEEIVPSRRRKYTYLADKKVLVQKAIEEMLTAELSSKSKSKSTKIIPGSSTLRKRLESKDIMMSRKNINSFTEIAADVVEIQMGPFKDPYSSENITTRNGTLYCLGNNALSYISLAYNDLTCLSVKSLYSVLSTQLNLNRTPKGLVNVCIDGNDLNDTCCDLERVNSIIEQNLVVSRTVITPIPTKKKGASAK